MTRDRPLPPCWRPPVRWLLAATGCLIAGGCGREAAHPLHDQVDYSRLTDLFDDPLPTARPATLAPTSVVARVGGEPVHLIEVERELRLSLSMAGGRVPAEQIPALLPDLRRQALQVVIARRLLADAMVDEGISASSDEIEALRAALRGSLPGDLTWEAFLEQARLTEESLKEQLAARIRLDRLLKRRLPEPDEPSEADLRTVYEQNKDRIARPFDEVRDPLTAHLKALARRRALSSYLEQLQQSAEVEILLQPAGERERAGEAVGRQSGL